MSKTWYRSGILAGKFVAFVALRIGQIRPEIAHRPGGYVLALTHQGHLDPIVSSLIVKRHIRWMARQEFFRTRWQRWLLGKMEAFSVNRQGIPVASVRRAIELARSGEVVGICPEGEVRRSGECAFRGGLLKRGVCSVAIRAGVPIVPCVILGTHTLNRVRPWLPTKSGCLWVAYGTPLVPPSGKSTRAKRDLLRDRLSRAYVGLYAEMRERFGIDDADVP
jgi:1-acyl-sn-glycerol-3-phosphate acyltransferase